MIKLTTNANFEAKKELEAMRNFNPVYEIEEAPEPFIILDDDFVFETEADELEFHATNF